LSFSSDCSCMFSLAWCGTSHAYPGGQVPLTPVASCHSPPPPLHAVGKMLLHFTARHRPSMVEIAPHSACITTSLACQSECMNMMSWFGKPDVQCNPLGPSELFLNERQITLNILMSVLHLIRVSQEATQTGSQLFTQRQRFAACATLVSSPTKKD
jgi:hypothetical protein